MIRDRTTGVLTIAFMTTLAVMILKRLDFTTRVSDVLRGLQLIHPEAHHNVISLSCRIGIERQEFADDQRFTRKQIARF